MTDDEIAAALYEVGAAPEGASRYQNKVQVVCPGRELANGDMYWIDWSPATDIAAAIEMAKAKFPGCWSVGESIDESGGHFCCGMVGRSYHYAEFATPDAEAHALSLAVLAAMKEEK